ncbi:MAG: hypothetical protein EOO20_03000 [Chryseobacterium sp.]|nr:RES family NAD+ phosphorylase [Agrobacterium tumefaciens]NTE26882.1 RES family NAD+ phosphorylase [Agrobacterium tumefaciens]RZJ92078.1 MAG: hypothetical protein EOO20_03000 [Chryseobacterium sp.]
METVCRDCFLDEELRGFIIAQAKLGACPCCQSTEVETIALAELYDFFNELFANFQLSTKGETIIQKLQGNWDLFKSNAIASKILNAVIPSISTSIQSIDESVDFNEEIIANINYWQTLKEQLKWERRYLTDIAYLTEDLGWDSFFNSKINLKKEDHYFRARIHTQPATASFPLEEMNCPPKAISTAGRSNPIGIPYLYLSDNPDTILYEIRASYLDEVTIATFSVADSVTEKVKISDFTEIPTLFHPSEVNKRIKSTLLKKSISIDLSKPMRRYDSELDYIPTQFICEFIKVFTGVQGIKFRSSLHPTGNNIVIFDNNLLTCRSVEKHQISAVTIKSRKA